MKFLCCLLLLVASSAAQNVPVFEPLFSSAGVFTLVDERAPQGTLVLNVQARASAGQSIVYGLELPSGAEGVFQVDPQFGNITVGPDGPSMLVIRNHIQTTFVFQAFAYYNLSGLSGDRAYLRVTVDVRDINDPPLFGEQSVEIGTAEGVAIGTTLRRLVAVDNDFSLNGAVSYSLEQITPDVSATGLIFSIRPFTGDLITTQILVLGTEYQLRVTATDEGTPPLSSSVSVTVRVVPTPPTFDSSIYSVSVAEFTGMDPVVLTTVRATDATPETTGQILYSIASFIPPNSDVTFMAGSTSGVITVNGTLDRETLSRYIVQVSAYEDTTPFSTSQTTVVVLVEDVNEPPEFLSSHYSVGVSEGVPIGEILFSGELAVDGDEGANSTLSYSISRIEGLQTADGARVQVTSPFFVINSTTGVITVNTDLEREAAVDGFHYYELTVVATDGGTPPLTADTTVAVTVLDVNDSPPEFNSTFLTFMVPEDEPAGTIVGEFLVTDVDQGSAAELVFSLVGPMADRFNVEVASTSLSNFVEAQPPTVTTGRLTTTEILDREDITMYPLTIIARDVTDNPLNMSVSILITVIDKNDNTPTFSSSSFNFELPENKQDTFVTEFMVMDPDSGNNGVIDFSIDASDGSLFNLVGTSSQSAQLHLNHQLDRETTESYSFRIFAVDRGSPALGGQAQVTIRVSDVNDNNPAFNQTTYEVMVEENTPAGTLVTTLNAVDNDAGINGQVAYYGDVNELVTVNNITGDVVLLVSPDFEAIQSTMTTVTAADFGSPQLSGTANLVITITDVNDNPPVFQRDAYTASVFEDISEQSQVVRVVATDEDSGDFGTVTYSLLNANDSTFSINNVSGAITVMNALDRESVSSYILTVVASDRGQPPMSSQASVGIQVFDVNDNSPQFIGEPYVTQVNEGSDGSPGAFVFSVQAEDADDGTNGEVIYSLVGNGADQFAINATSGEILVSPIGVDYERFISNNTLELSVIATDQGSPTRITTTTISITIIDGNDNAPVFIGAPFVTMITEGFVETRMAVLQVTATDADSGLNGQVLYSIASDNFGDFQIDATTGEIFLAAGVNLDREINTVSYDEDGNAIYSIGVAVNDLGTPTQLTYTPVIILVSDVNDNSPVFTNDVYEFSLSENISVGTPVFNLIATDADFGFNGLVNYTIVYEESTSRGMVFENFALAIDPDTGVLSIALSLDRELGSDLNVVVVATDQGIGYNQANATVMINITDANDNHPVFVIPPGGFEAMISEDAQVGTSVFTVEAVDLDQSFQTITYSILTGTNETVPFTIADPNVGLITVSNPLDRETTPVHNLIVVARDSGPVSLESFAMVRVILEDVNDNAPEFNSLTYVGRVQENLAPGALVTLTPSFAVVDPDMSPFELILVGPSEELFSIDNNTGVITTTRQFDFEGISTYTDFVLIAIDNGGFFSNASLEIQITDDNDHSPVFAIDFLQLNVSELTSNGTEIIVVEATDRDQEDNGFVMYMLNEDEVGGLFAIHPVSGAIAVNGVLDFETQQTYLLNITGQDGGDIPRQGFLSIEVTILDENDNSPIIQNPNPSFTITENIGFDQVVGGIAALDADTGTNGEIVYEITGGNDGNRFVIDPENGTITTNATIDREEQELYTLVVEARDSAPFPRSDQTSVSIMITDENDNAPIFPNSPLTINLTENTPANFLVTTFSAEDADVGSNQQLTYAFTFQSPQPHFSIDSMTGEVTTIVILDRESVARYELAVTATDAGSPPQTAFGTIIINILDLNDNDPVFMSNTFSASIIENAQRNSFVVTPLATDADSSSNGQLVYSIIGGNSGNAFQIDTSSGIVSVQENSVLDYENVRTFFLQVSVRDMGDTIRTAQALVLVSLTDENDNSPIFTSSTPTSVSVVENTSPGSIVTVVTATDADQGSNGAITYSITSGDPNGDFSVVDDGSVTTSKTLDYEAQQTYNLVIEALDGGFPALQATTSLMVSVTDMNDNAPQFILSPGDENLFVVESAPVDFIIARITATDGDTGVNGQVSYFIVNQANNQQFRLDRNNGLLSLAATLDRETTSSLTLTIEASDSGNPQQSTQQQFFVTVNDVDDNLPTFSEPPVFTILENQQPFVSFGSIQTEDFDIPPNNEVFFFIIDGPQRTLFGIGGSGLIFLTQAVDYDAGDVQLVVQIALKSNDVSPGTGPFNSCTSETCTEADLIVNVMDVNDNEPQLRNVYDFGVNESSSADSFVGLINATDIDSGAFGTVIYQLLQTLNFSIGRDSGMITLNAKYNASIHSKYNTFSVMATDNPGGNPSFATTATVRAYFVNLNDLVLVTISGPATQVEQNMDQIIMNLAAMSVVLYDYKEIEVPVMVSAQRKRQVETETRTELRVFGANHTSQSILPSSELIKVLSNADTIGGLSVQTVELPDTSGGSFTLTIIQQIILICVVVGVVLIFFLIFLLICCITWCVKRRGRKNQFSPGANERPSKKRPQPEYSISGAKDAYDNPLWLDPYHNWSEKVEREEVEGVKYRDRKSPMRKSEVIRESMFVDAKDFVMKDFHNNDFGREDEEVMVEIKPDTQSLHSTIDRDKDGDKLPLMKSNRWQQMEDEEDDLRARAQIELTVEESESEEEETDEEETDEEETEEEEGTDDEEEEEDDEDEEEEDEEEEEEEQEDEDEEEEEEDDEEDEDEDEEEEEEEEEYEDGTEGFAVPDSDPLLF